MVASSRRDLPGSSLPPPSMPTPGDCSRRRCIDGQPSHPHLTYDPAGEDSSALPHLWADQIAHAQNTFATYNHTTWRRQPPRFVPGRYLFREEEKIRDIFPEVIVIFLFLRYE